VQEKICMKLYKDGYGDNDIARACGVTVYTIQKWRENNELERNLQESICWNCKNARAKKCAWIGRMEKVWDKARKETRVANQGRCEIYFVEKCKNFEPEVRKAAGA